MFPNDEEEAWYCVDSGMNFEAVGEQIEELEVSGGKDISSENALEMLMKGPLSSDCGWQGIRTMPIMLCFVWFER